MTTYNTGNPIGSTDPRDLFDNAENLDDAVNTQTSNTWVDRKGVTRLSWKGIETAASTNELTYNTKAEMDAAPGTVVGQRARVINDPVAANNGLYLWDGNSWELSENDPLEDLANDQNNSFVPAFRDGSVSAAPKQFMNFVKAATVSGIERGKIVKIEYFQNKSTGFLPAIDAFIFSIFDGKDFSNRVQLNNRSDGEVFLDRTLTKQVVQLEFQGILFTLLLNPSALPPEGTALFANQPTTPGYSWYIGETGYEYKAQPEYQMSPFFDYGDTAQILLLDANNRPIEDQGSSVETLTYSPFFSYDDATSYDEVDKSGNLLRPSGETPTPPDVFGTMGEIFVDYKHETKELGVAWSHDKNYMCKAVWKPNGFNNVFNFYQFLFAPHGDPDTAVWTLKQSSSTDYIPPITHLATSGVTSPNVFTTGGNHPGANGEFTGFMQECDFFLDGRWPLSGDYKGFHDFLTVRWRNGLCAGNTVTEQRITTQQDFVAVFAARCVEVLSKVTALEPIEILREGGTQMVFSGWEDGGYHFWGGKQQGPVRYLQRSGSLMAATRSANVISGTATAGNTINAVRNGTTIGTTTVLSTGAYSITTTTNMFDGDEVVVNEVNGATTVATVTVQYILSAGTKLEAPTAWANVVKDNTLGYFAAWIDRSFGVKMDWVKDDNPPSTRNLSKCYNFSVKWDRVGGNTDPYRQMATGDSYSWRGGYAYSPIDIVDGLDSAFVFKQNGRNRLAIANAATSLNGTLKLPGEFISTEFSEIGSADSIGTLMNFAEYTAKFYKEEI